MTTCRRFHRIGNDFTLCVNIGKKDYVLAENPIDSNTIFYYGIKGIGKLGTMFSEDYVLVKEGEFVDVRSYLHKFRIFHSQEDFHLVGFNTLEKGQNWEGRLIKSDEEVLDLHVIRELHKISFLVCFDGKPIVNDKTMKRYEYARLDVSKEYKVNLNGGALGLFYKN
tara:strand:- start:574 stop:1074 length:501 start_codon:yes stop_codon:yes gene_type:complete